MSLRDKQKNIYLSCPDCVGIVFNFGEHGTLLKTSARFVRQQVESHPEILRLGQDVAAADKVAEKAREASAELRRAADEVSRLERTLRRMLKRDPSLKGPADKVEVARKRDFSPAIKAVGVAMAVSVSSLLLSRRWWSQ